MKKLNVGIIGYSAKKFDKDVAKAFLDQTFERLGNNIVIVSGLTNIGVPAIAYELAKQRGLKTIGVACSKAQEYDCFPVDEKIIVGDDWGHESKTFLDMVDIIVKIGGGQQSENEAKLAREMGKSVLELPLPVLP